MKDVSPKNRRKFPRIPCKILCEFEIENQNYAAMLENISEQGFFICTEELQDVGSEVLITIHGDKMYKINGKVVRSVFLPNDPLSSQSSGMGIEVVHVTEEHKGFVKKLEASFVINNKKIVPRYETVQKVQFESEKKFITAYTKDISKGGFYISTKEKLDPGSILHAQLDIPGVDEPIEIEGKVTHYLSEEEARASGKTAGAGVQFLELTTKAKNILFHFIKRLNIHQKSFQRKQTNLPSKGSLTDYLVPEILIEIKNKNKTGSLKISRKGIEKTIYFQHGVPFYVESDILSEMLSNFLIRKGKLLKHEALLLFDELEERNIKFGELLVESKIIDRVELKELLVAQQEEKIFNMFPWFEGNFQFVESDKWPKNISFFALDTFRILESGVNQWFGIEVIRAWMGLDEHTFVLAKDAESATAFPSKIFKVLRLAKDPILIGEISQKLNEDISGVIKKCFVAILSGGLEVSSEGEQPKETQHLNEDNRKVGASSLSDILIKKIEYDYERFQGMDFFKILNVEVEDKEIDIKKKFNEKMLKYPPNLIQTIEDPKIIKKAESILQIIRLAFHTLTNESLRRIYVSKSSSKSNSQGRKDKMELEKYLFKAIAFIDSNKFSEARVVLNHAQKKYLKDASVEGYLAWTDFCIDPDKNVEESLVSIRNAIESERTDTQLLYYCGKMLVHKKKWKKAERMFQRVLKFNPRFVQAEAEYERAKNYRILEENT